MGLALERGGHFQKACFYRFTEKSRCPSCSAFPWGLLGLSGHPLGRFRGPNNQTKDTSTLRPAVHRVLRLRTGCQGSTRRRNTTDRRAESLRRDRCVFKNPCKIQRFRSFWHPPGIQNCSKTYIFEFSSCRGVSPKTPPKGISAKGARKKWCFSTKDKQTSEYCATCSQEARDVCENETDTHRDD